MPEPPATAESLPAPATPLVPTDIELVTRIQGDDGRALELLARRYTPKLATVAYAILGSDDLVEDVIQDAFVALWERRTALDPADNVPGYLYRAVRNRALNLLRHERVEHRAAHQFAVDAATALPSAANFAEQALRAADVNARVYAALRDVPPGPRAAFLLYWEHDLTYAEIAEALNLTISNVRQQMYRATQRLGRRLLGGGLD